MRNIVLFEKIAKNPSNFIYRLIGTKLTEIAGHVTGKTFEESVPPEILPRWIECGDLILDGGQPLRFRAASTFKDANISMPNTSMCHWPTTMTFPSYIMGLCRYVPHSAENEESWENQIASIPGGLL